MADEPASTHARYYLVAPKQCPQCHGRMFFNVHFEGLEFTNDNGLLLACFKALCPCVQLTVESEGRVESDAYIPMRRP